MILKTCPHCQSVNLIDENCDTFYCSRCGEKIRINNADKVVHNWDFRGKPVSKSNIPANIDAAFNCLFSEDYHTAHEMFKRELSTDADNLYALTGEAICAPYSRSTYFSKLKSHSDDISEEEMQLINKENSKIFSQLYCEFDDDKRIDYMISNFPSSITIDLLTKNCYKNKNINITSVLISGYVSTTDIFNKFMEFAYTSNNLYSSFDSRYLRPSELALLISAGLSTTEKIISLKKYDTVNNSINVVEEKVSLKDFFQKYFNGAFSTSDDSIVCDYYRFYGHSYYDNSGTRKNITVTPESYLNIIQNYKIKTKYKDIKEYNCYMATYVFDSYNCPELWVLRRFRDKKLYSEKSIFPYIDLYYQISPKILKLFERSTTFQSFVKSFLFRLVQYLKSRGYEDTPYSDFI